MPDPYRVLVTGSRNWADRAVIRAGLDDVAIRHDDVAVVHGACPTGADKIADEWATDRGMRPPERHPAQWDRYGNPAGQIRNQAMVDTRPDECLAYNLHNSNGTAGCVRKAVTAGIPTAVLYRNTSDATTFRRYNESIAAAPGTAITNLDRAAKLLTGGDTSLPPWVSGLVADMFAGVRDDLETVYGDCTHGCDACGTHKWVIHNAGACGEAVWPRPPVDDECRCGFVTGAVALAVAITNGSAA